ncbi:hypothetical protein JW859_00030 [bacterium]|nr:hypothetical protein [bacterium]
MVFGESIWWGMFLLLEAMIVPIVWIMYWIQLFEGSLFERVFGDRFMKSWLARSYRAYKRDKPKDVWRMCAGTGIGVAIY